MKSYHPESAFSLIEVIVTIAIFAFISTIILLSYPRLSNRLAFSRTVQEVAQSIRQAQTYSIGVAAFGGFESPYGVYFSKSEQHRYIFFADRNEDKIYNPPPDISDSVICPLEGSTGECVNKLEIPSSVSIVDLCIETTCGVPQLHITYKRPAPTVFFSGGTSNADLPNPNVRVVLRGSDESQKSIVIWKTGQVAIENQ